jgi:hypothetical protein
LLVMYLYAFQINPKPSISHMGATKRNNFGQQPTAYYKRGTILRITT